MHAKLGSLAWQRYGALVGVYIQCRVAWLGRLHHPLHCLITKPMGGSPVWHQLAQTLLPHLHQPSTSASQNSPRLIRQLASPRLAAPTITEATYPQSQNANLPHVIFPNQSIACLGYLSWPRILHQLASTPRLSLSIPGVGTPSRVPHLGPIVETIHIAILLSRTSIVEAIGTTPNHLLVQTGQRKHG
jgi:hypothetical protein